MTIEEITGVVVAVDPAAQRYESTNRSGNFTAWAEYRRLPVFADGHHIEAWAFQVDRFTREENDEIARAFFEAFDSNPRISFTHQIDYENDTRYIHHIYDCEAV